ncbi:hypothetical protein SFRURICE_005752 [Spodoptera frugiperda]|nr:hypothetical protein SFRURICE_005752 [Spodoptera frugiperda]
MKINFKAQELPAGPTVAVTVAAVAVAVSLVVDSLHDWDGVLLHNWHGHLDQLHDWNFNNLLDGHGVVYVYFHNLLVWNLHDLLDGVGHWLVNLNLLDLHNWYWYVLDDWHLNGVGLGYWDLDSLGYGVRHRLGHSVGNFPEDLVRLLTDAVLSRSTVTISKTVDLFDNRGLGTWGWSISSGNSQSRSSESRSTESGSTKTSTAESRTTVKTGSTDSGSTDSRSTADAW